MISTLANIILGNKLGDKLWKIQLERSDFVNIWSQKTFWVEALPAWTEYNYCEPKDGNEVRQQIIWLNSKIKVDNRPVWYLEWIGKGIYKIEDIWEENKFLDFTQF